MRITNAMLNEKITYANEMLDTTITNRNFKFAIPTCNFSQKINNLRK